MQTAQDILNFYINKAHAYPYRTTFNDGMTYINYEPSNVTIADWYKEARRVWLIECTFEEFKWMVLEKRTSLYWKYYRYKAKKFSWSWNYENRHRICRKYIKQPHHKKKVLSEEEIAKREYHERKGSNKDRRKTYWKRGAGKFYKQYSNQKHRAWQKDKISNGDYCFSDTDYKYFCDPWLWD